MGFIGRATFALLACVSSIHYSAAFLASSRIAVPVPDQHGIPAVSSARRSQIDARPLIPALTSKSSAQDAPSADTPSKLERLAASLSQSSAVKFSQRYKEAGPVMTEQSPFNLITLIRVGIPAVLGGIFATLIFPGLAMFLASIMNDAGVFAVLSQDSSQFVQNFLTVSGLLFSIIVGQT